MTTPTIDFALPVSFTLVRQAGSDQLMRADGGDHYRLEGPSMVAASWSGPQKAEIWHQHKTADGWRWRKLAEFNGGGGATVRVGAKPGEYVVVYVRPAATASDVAEDHRGTLTIYPV